MSYILNAIIIDGAYSWRFFFTDAVISAADLGDDSKTFRFTAVDPATHKSNLITD